MISKPTSNIPGLEISGAEDGVISSSLSLAYNHVFDSHWFINSRYSLNNNAYFDNTPLNVIVSNLEVTPSYNFDNSALSLYSSFIHSRLNGNGYMDLATIKPQWSQRFSEKGIGQLSLGYSKREMLINLSTDEDRDSDIYSVSVGYNHISEDNLGNANIFYEYAVDDTKGKNWVKNQHRIATGLLIPLENKLKLLISGEAALHSYENEHSIYSKKRTDRVYIGLASLRWDVYESSVINLSYNYSRYDSNIDIYDYYRNIVKLGLEYNF